MSEKPTCSICGEAMPSGEEMFTYHGYSGPCPKPPMVVKKAHWTAVDFRHPEFEGITKVELNLSENGEQKWVEAVWYKGDMVVRKDQLGLMPALPLAAAQGSF